jgi:hypothetical protein
LHDPAFSEIRSEISEIRQQQCSKGHEIHREFIGMCFRWDSKQRAPSAAELPRKVMKMALRRGEEGHRPEGHQLGKA